MDWAAPLDSGQKHAGMTARVMVTLFYGVLFRSFRNRPYSE
jgi:hypothetical protein